MVRKGLLQIEWKQQKWQLIFGFLFISFFLPVELLNSYMSWKEYAYDQPVFQFYFTGRVSMYLIISVVFAVTLAITQMGGERGKGVLDFQLTLPYSRGEMFITKLTLGLFYIITSIVISFSLTGFILEFSQAQHEYFSQFYIHLIVTVIMSYTITLAVGSFTGNLFAQGLTALGIAVLPFFLFLILSTHGAIVYSEWLNRANSPFDQIIDKIVQFAPIYYAFYGDLFAQYENLHVWIPLWFSLMFTIIGYFAFIHQPYERNGNFFLWMQLNRPVQLLVIIIGVLGFGAFGYYSSGESTGGYLVGAIVGATVGFIFSYFTIFRKSKRS